MGLYIRNRGKRGERLWCAWKNYASKYIAKHRVVDTPHG